MKQTYYDKMQRIPFDIFINHIIPYTYKTQSKPLLEDVKNHFIIKSTLLCYDYAYSMKDLLLLQYYMNKQKINNFLEVSKEDRAMFSECVSHQLYSWKFHRWLNNRRKQSV